MPKSTPRQNARYAALGSSFAAGPGIPPVVDAKAARSGRNYPHQVAAALGLDLIDVTHSGATTANVLKAPRSGRPPQIDAVTSDCELVTITAGGNDLGYVGTLLKAGALGAVLGCAPWLSVARRERIGDRVGFAVPPEAYEAVAASQAEIVRRVRERAPRARVLLVDYLTLISDPPPDPNSVRLTSAQIDAAAAVGRGLAAAFRIAAERSGAELVAASAASAAHGVGSADPWVHGLEIGLPNRGPTPYHPNSTGMTKVAELVVDAVRRPSAAGGS